MSQSNPNAGQPAPKFKPLDDLSPMPFGKHKGTPMQDVPASYFHWLWTEIQHDKSSPVGDYIRRNLNALRKELPDAIWT